MIRKVIVLLCLSVLFVFPAFGKEKYQTYIKAQCEWCGCSNSLLNALNVHHFFTQSRHPKWKNVEMNTVTLCRKCHYVFHKRNWKLEAPEVCLLFGKTIEQVRERCVEETGSIDGR